MDTLVQAAGLVFHLEVLGVILASAAYGMFVGSVPGLTASMATALLVPITFFMPPVPAIAAIVTSAATAIFAGDIPGALLRIPGTPASAAYVDDAYRMTQAGQSHLALGACLVFSVIGGVFGCAVLVTAAPALAEAALSFSSYEYFWLVLAGLSCAVFISTGSRLKAGLSLLLGLLAASVGMDNPAGVPRFTFGVFDLAGGVNLIPVMIGVFALPELIRFYVGPRQGTAAGAVAGSGSNRVFAGQWGLLKRYRWGVVRGSVLGTAVGALPGAGGDIAAWMAYAMSKRLSRTPEKFGTGHPEGLVEAGAANNAALSGTWIPTLVFGIPGDSITAIAIGVLYLKNLNPGPMIFVENAASLYAIFIIFFLANLLMLPLGWACILAAGRLVRAPRHLLMPAILAFCVVGAFASTNSWFAVGTVLAFGLLAYVMEENGFPLGPLVLGLVLGGQLEETFLSSMIKADGRLFAFVERPVAAGIALCVAALWITSLVLGGRRRRPRVSP